MVPEDLKYHREHTWIKISGKKATIGMTDYAQKALGDIVYIDLPETDTSIQANTEFAEIESTKTTSTVISPLSGTILSVNDDLSESPETINEEPYGKGWIAVIEIEDKSEFDNLMDSSDYEKHIEENE
jgi:glycine cleavage system H protein